MPDIWDIGNDSYVVVVIFDNLDILIVLDHSNIRNWMDTSVGLVFRVSPLWRSVALMLDTMDVVVLAVSIVVVVGDEDHALIVVVAVVVVEPPSVLDVDDGAHFGNGDGGGASE